MTIPQNRIWILLIAATVDLVIGDPHGLWHPVQGIGALISRTESAFRGLFCVPCKKPDVPGAASEQSGSGDITHSRPETAAFHRRERAAGALLVLLVPAVSTGAVLALLAACRRIHPWLGILAEGVLCGRLLALRSLGEAGFSVRDPLLRGDIEAARHAVSMIVGRDTERLDARGIAKAAVETVAENTSDGVTAPLFYMILFGGAGGIFYKAVNTMDSMIGYKNDRYRYFGTAAARLDDVMNYIPSRLSALLMILACAVPFRGSLAKASSDRMPVNTSSGKQSYAGRTAAVPREKNSGRNAAADITLPDMRAAFRIWRRDHAKSPSPNSAQTESVCAGALHLRLLGDTWYFGELHHKEEIGDGGRTIEAADITRTVHLMTRTSCLLFTIGLAALLLLSGI